MWHYQTTSSQVFPQSKKQDWRRRKMFCLCRQNAWNYSYFGVETLQWTESIGLMDRLQLTKESNLWQNERKFSCNELLIFNVQAIFPKFQKFISFQSLENSFLFDKFSPSFCQMLLKKEFSWMSSAGVISLGEICKFEHLIRKKWWEFQWKMNLKEGLKPPMLCGCLMGYH